MSISEETTGAVGDLFFENLAYALGGAPLDYVIVQHMEPDHSATFARLIELYPDVTVVTSQKAAVMLKNYFGYAGQAHLVKEGDTLSIGKRTLTFVGAPMVHWPEVLFTYVPEDGILFSADAFGTFGAVSGSIIGGGTENFHRLPASRSRLEGRLCLVSG